MDRTPHPKTIDLGLSLIIISRQYGPCGSFIIFIKGIVSPQKGHSIPRKDVILSHLFPFRCPYKHSKTIFSGAMGIFLFFQKEQILSQFIRNPLFLIKWNTLPIFNNYLTGQMKEAETPQLILIYYNIRGKAQVIRTLLCYLSLHFVELHLELIEKERQHPEEHIINLLKAQPINRSKLPLLVDGSSYIYGSLAIALHLCKRSHRGDLLGKNQCQMVEVQQILQLLSHYQIKCKTQLLDFAERSIVKTEREVRQLLNLTFENVMNNSHYIRQLCQKLQTHHKGFIFGNLTLVDFFYLETCFYVLGFFGGLDKQYTRSFESFYNSIVEVDLRRRSNKMYLDEMRLFVNKMHNLPFYETHREYLESFSIIFENMGSDRIKGLKKIWIGETKYIQ